jgi:hypothetical protein
MDKIESIKIETAEGLLDYVIIDRGNGEFTSMPKSTYDEMQAEQSTPSV